MYNRFNKVTQKEDELMSMAKKIKILLVEKEMNMSDLANLLNTSQPNLSKKMKLDNFRENELVEIAELIGVTYEAKFILEDGRTI